MSPKTLRLLLACLFAQPVVVAAGGSTGETSECQLKLLAKVDIRISHAGGVTIPVKINGQAIRMALDTSGLLNAVSDRTADRLMLKRQSTGKWTYGMGGVSTREFANLPRLSIGNLSWGEAEALILPNSYLADRTESDGGIPGSLGMMTFSNVDLELDIASRSMMIYSQDHCPGSVVHWSNVYYKVDMKQAEHGFLYFPMELVGRRVDTTLSTSDRQSVLTSDAARKAFGIMKNSPEVHHERGISGASDYFRAMELTSDGLNIMNARIGLGTPKCRPGSLVVPKNPADSVRYTVHDGNSTCLAAPLQLGVDLLSKMHLYLAFREKALYFTVAETAPKAAPLSSTDGGPARQAAQRPEQPR